MSEEQNKAVNAYEGMFIFPDTIKEEGLEEAQGRVKAEIERLGGAVQSTIRLGRRTFARPMQKKEAGYYVVVGFTLAGAQVGALQERLKLSGEVFRAQINRAPAAAPEEAGHAVAQ